MVEAPPAAAHTGQRAAIVEVPGDVDEDRVEMLWRHRAGEVPYRAATGDLLRSEVREAVRETAVFGKRLPMGEK